MNDYEFMRTYATVDTGRDADLDRLNAIIERYIKPATEGNERITNCFVTPEEPRDWAHRAAWMAELTSSVDVRCNYLVVGETMHVSVEEFRALSEEVLQRYSLSARATDDGLSVALTKLP